MSQNQGLIVQAVDIGRHRNFSLALRIPSPVRNERHRLRIDFIVIVAVPALLGNRAGIVGMCEQGRGD